jgi:hypothetical protein
MSSVNMTAIAPANTAEPLATTEHPVPHQIHPYRDYARQRSDFPLCAFAEEGIPVVRPLREVLDGLLESMRTEGDDGERFRRAVMKIEVRIRTDIIDGADGGILDAWDAHVEALARETARQPAAQSALQAHLAEARALLPSDGALMPFGETLPLQLLGRAAGVRPPLDPDLHRRLDVLIEQLEEMMAGRSGDAGARATRGYSNGEIDTVALGEMLRGVPVAAPLPEARRLRIQRIIETLRVHAPLLLDGQESPAGALVSLADAREEAGRRIQAAVSLFRSIHQGTLEIRDAYSEEKHGAFFRDYVPSDEELEVCPPVLVHVDADRMQPGDVDALLDLLTSRAPVKILATTGRLFDEPGALDQGIRLAPRRARLAALAMGLETSFVGQTVLTATDGLWRMLVDGMRYNGPALICVYTGSGVDCGDLHPCLAVAAAREARAFPAFTFDPSRGPGRADRFDLSDNAAPVNTWPRDEEAEQSSTLPFTFADFLLCDRDFAGHFRKVDEERLREVLVPVHEYASGDSDEMYGRVPFVLATAADGTQTHLAVSGAVVDATRRAASAWRSLQELAGIDNSHVNRQVAVLRTELQEEMRAALEEAERRHSEALGRATTALAEDIVSNIAAGLLRVEAAAPPAPARPAPASEPRKEAPPTESAPAPAPPVEEEEEVLSLDHAYIVTPRCTTCNECTTINNRMFVYNADKQAEIADLSAGTFREMVLAAEKCPVRIIYPGKPWDPTEPGLTDLIERAAAFQ